MQVMGNDISGSQTTPIAAEVTPAPKVAFSQRASERPLIQTELFSAYETIQPARQPRTVRARCYTRKKDRAVSPGGPVDAMPAFLRIGDVVRITALSRPTLYRRIAAQRFPPPVHLGGRACGWHSAAVQTWINDPNGYRAPAAGEPDGPRRRGRPRKYPLR